MFKLVLYELKKYPFYIPLIDINSGGEESYMKWGGLKIVCLYIQAPLRHTRTYTHMRTYINTHEREHTHVRARTDRALD